MNKDKNNDHKVKEIMEEVKRRIRKRGHNIPQLYLMEKADISAKRLITSHRKVIGPPLIKVRKFIHEEIVRAVTPMMTKQTDFNYTMAKLLLEMNEKINKMKKEINKMKYGVRSRAIKKSKKEKRKKKNEYRNRPPITNI